MNSAAITLLDKEVARHKSHADWCAQQATNHEETAAGFRERERVAREQAAELRRAREFL